MRKIFDKIKSFIFYDSSGNIATASFFICLISGVLLAIPYDVTNPFRSISFLMIFDPFSSMIRNIHYWSAQFFLIFTLIHIWDHFKLKSEERVSSGIWIRLTISITFLFYVMLSGFILKGDSDSLHAFSILYSLIKSIPLFGENIALSILGEESDLQLLYIHHTATATIYLLVIIIEHTKKIWVETSTILYSSFFIILLSFIFTPGLHDELDPIIKGPWYFLGLQEILHWLSIPGLTIILVFIFFIVFYLIPKLNANYKMLVKYYLLYITVIYFILCVFALAFRGENWEFVWPWENKYFEKSIFEIIDFSTPDSIDLNDTKIILGQYESCIVCHNEIKGFSPSHNPEAIGCYSCHLGNPFSLNKDFAHSGMIINAGDLSIAKYTCGNIKCHPGISERVNMSIMNTLSGMISVDKFVFDEIEKPDGLFNVKDLQHSPADSHLRNLCVSCHISNIKELGPITELTRGGGCSACHLNYKDSAKREFNEVYRNRKDPVLTKFHPSLDLDISNNHCFGCHSRSGRISTNYEGWHETTYETIPLDSNKKFRKLGDGRIFEFVESDVHHQAGMICIDCHNSYEVMGDGNSYEHKEQQVKIECTDCHSNNHENMKYFREFDHESKKIALLRNLVDSSRVYLTVTESGDPIINTKVESNIATLYRKSDKKVLELNPPKSVCTEGIAHNKLSCQSCHAAWAPQCVGCHTEYKSDTPSFDLLANNDIKGAWEESFGEFLAEPPVLGIVSDVKNGEKTVKNFIPGMVMTLNKSMDLETNDIIFHRLYSPAFSHTISKKSRTCINCHLNPLALGFGRGELKFNKNGKFGKFEFIPKYENNPNDNLPEDAWIGFLSETRALKSTRNNARPLNLEEQKRILFVGACLTCHEERSQIINNTLMMKNVLDAKLSPQCIIPRF